MEFAGLSGSLFRGFRGPQEKKELSIESPVFKGRKIRGFRGKQDPPKASFNKRCHLLRWVRQKVLQLAWTRDPALFAVLDDDTV